MRRVLVSGLLYLGTVLPLHAIVLLVELVARGHHTASALDGISEWAVFIAPSLMLLGATAVPVSILAYRAVKRRVPAAHRAWWLAGLMPLLLALNVVILGLVISISGGSPWSLTPLVIMSPIAFVLSAAAYGWVLGRRNWPPGHAAHEV